MDPDSKLPWIVLVMTMPLFGTVLYVMFAKNTVSLKEKRLTPQLYEHAKGLLSSHGNAEIDAPYKGQSEYIKNTTALPVYEKCDCDYFPSGEKFWEALKEDFETTFDECILQDENTVKMNFLKKLICVLARIFTPLL